MSKYKNWLDVVHSDEPHRCYMPKGDREVDKKHLVINKKGYPALESCGKTNLYDQIQSYRDSCDLESILKTFDIGALPALSFDDLGDITDFTDAPKSAGELLRVVEDGKLMFSQLPAAVRSEYNNSLYNFIGSFGSADFVQRLSRAYGVFEDTSAGVTSDGSGVSDNQSIPVSDAGSGQNGTPDYVNVSGAPAVNVKDTMKGANE